MKKKIVTTRRRAPRKLINEKPVVDVDRPLIFSINAKDTKGSDPKSTENCAAARAICRQEHALGVHVFRSRIYVEFADRVERYVTPARLRQETISFDRGSPPKFLEGEYRLLPATESRKLGRDHRTRPTPKPRGNGTPGGLPRFEVDGARPTGNPHVRFFRPDPI